MLTVKQVTASRAHTAIAATAAVSMRTSYSCLSIAVVQVPDHLIICVLLVKQIVELAATAGLVLKETRVFDATAWCAAGYCSRGYRYIETSTIHFHSRYSAACHCCQTADVESLRH
jgi:hypothetical protein